VATSRTTPPSPGAKGFLLSVMPNRDHLSAAIAQNGSCNPKKCWHYVAINALMSRWAPDERHSVRVDAGHIKLNYRGWRYIADTPLHVKRSLMLFDKGLYDEVHVRRYSLRFRRTTKIIPQTEEARIAHNERRKIRLAHGSEENKRAKRSNLSARVEGFSGIV
jgi:hypothetical protein